MHTVTITRVRLAPGVPPADPLASGRDRHGDPLPDPSPASPREVHVPIHDVIVAASVSTSETQAGRDVITTERVLYLPAGTDLRAEDVVELPGAADARGRPLRWAVQGTPAHPLPQVFTGRRFRTRVTVRRVEG